MSGNIVKLLISRIFLGSSLFALFAGSTIGRAGNDSSGGAHSVQGQLLDYWEQKGVEELRPLDVPGLEKIIEGVTARLPEFAVELTQALSKKWYLDPKNLMACPGGESLLDVDKKTVACQNRLEVRISKKWFFTPPIINKEDFKSEPYLRFVGNNPREALTLKQQGTIVHELLRAMVLRRGPSGASPAESEQVLRILVRKLVSNPGSESELQSIVEQSGFGHYSRQSYVIQQNAFLDTYQQEVQGIYAMAKQLKGLIAQAIVEQEQLAKQLVPINSKNEKELEGLVNQFKSGVINRTNYLQRVDEISASWRAEINTFIEQSNARLAPVYALREVILSKLDSLEKSRAYIGLSSHRELVRQYKELGHYLRYSCALNPSGYDRSWATIESRLSSMQSWEDTQLGFSELRAKFLTSEPRTQVGLK